MDTSVWSLALRRRGRANPVVVGELRDLILEHRVDIIGPVRQELLSGIRESAQFERLKADLSGFRDVPIDSDDYVTAAQFFNLCRSKGVQGSNTDFLICAIAARTGTAIFTTDKDFANYAEHLPITLHEIRQKDR